MTDTEIRLECVRLASGSVLGSETLKRSQEIYDFVTAGKDAALVGDLANVSYDAKYLHG